MNIEHHACKILVNKFVPNNDNWRREIKIAKKLLHLSPDIHSWLSLQIPFSINSLAFFLTEEGKIYIPESTHNPYLLDFDMLR